MACLAFIPLKSLLFLLAISLITPFTLSRTLEEVATPALSPELEIPDPVVSSAPEGPTVPVSHGDLHQPLSFFLHDIVGGTNPTARAVTGVVTNPALNAQVAFAKPNGANIPLNGGLPQNNQNAGFLNNNNLPFLTGLSGNTGNIVNNNNRNFFVNSNNNNGGAGFSVTNVNNMPAGMTLQKLMFGTMTVFDDELTEGHELGSGMVGKAQGFYMASAVDGTSQVLAFTAMFEENGYGDSISLFGVHRTQVSESHLAVVGGTGKYLNAKGYAIVKTFPVTGDLPGNGDGVQTLLQVIVYLA